MAKRRITAGEAIRQAQSDPESVAGRDARERKVLALRAVVADDEAELVREIKRLGYDVESVWDLVNNAPHPVLKRRFVGRYEGAYPVLIRHLSVPHHPRVREGVIRALTIKDGGQVLEECLLQELHSEQEPELRWLLANALRTAMPYHRRRKYPEIRAALRAECRAMEPSNPAVEQPAGSHTLAAAAHRGR